MKVIKTIEVIVLVFARLGFQLNFGKGITEVLFEFRGADAQKALLDVERTMTLKVAVPVGRSILVTVTSAYKHVGSILSVGASVVPDVKAKSIAMSHNVPCAIRKVLKAEGLSIPAKNSCCPSLYFFKGPNIVQRLANITTAGSKDVLVSHV